MLEDLWVGFLLGFLLGMLVIAQLTIAPQRRKIGLTRSSPPPTPEAMGKKMDKLFINKKVEGVRFDATS